MQFEFEGNTYVFTPMAVARMDQALAMIRDGASEEEAVEGMGLPGQDLEHNLRLFRLLRYYYEGGE